MLISAGESLVDLIQLDPSKPEGMIYKGSLEALRTIVQLQWLGWAEKLVSSVHFHPITSGNRLLNRLVEVGVTPWSLNAFLSAPSALAVVSIDHNGEPNYGFYRDNTAGQTN